MNKSTAESRKLYQDVAATVADDIARGVYPAGGRLPSERELGERFGVSRPTIREAMLALEIRGMVEARHGSGIYVVDNPHPERTAPELDIGAFELTEARMLFEGEAAALAATVITEEELAQLETLLEEMIRENEEGTSGELADRQFHLTIATATRNVAIAMVVEQLWDLRDRSPLCRHILEKARNVGVKPLIDEHRELLDALRAREPDRARRAMRNHLGRVIDGLLLATEMEALERARNEVAAKRTEYARRRAI